MFGEPELGSVLKNTAREIISSIMPAATTPERKPSREKS
jgi:hypothetical protein